MVFSSPRTKMYARVLRKLLFNCVPVPINSWLLSSSFLQVYLFITQANTKYNTGILLLLNSGCVCRSLRPLPTLICGGNCHRKPNPQSKHNYSKSYSTSQISQWKNILPIHWVKLRGLFWVKKVDSGHNSKPTFGNSSNRMVSVRLWLLLTYWRHSFLLPLKRSKTISRICSFFSRMVWKMKIPNCSWLP